MPFFTLPNLSAQLVENRIPWDVPHPGYPAEIDTKDKYRAWCLKPATDHLFFSLAEGANPAVRVSATNEPVRFHGVVVDYDAATTPELIASNLDNNCTPNLLPTFRSMTFSSGARLVWIFEEPVAFCTQEVAKRFFDKVSKEIRANKLLAGMDLNVWGNHAQFYEHGWGWESCGNAIPASLTRAWLMAASASPVAWRSAGTVIPIDIVREECAARWPGRWPGGWEQFQLNSRGTRFWDDSATNTAASVVRETGIQYFTDGGGFKQWSAIFGPDFVRHWQQERLGGAVGEFWFDSQGKYWRKIAGTWAPVERQDVLLNLRVNFGLKPAKSKTDSSELDEALVAIQSQQAVFAAAPFVFRPDGPIPFNDRKWLNISTVRPVMPIPGTSDHQWGQGFPWIATYFERLFDPQDQLEYFISWLAHFYKGALSKNPQRGLALFIAGPANAGKTFLNKALLGQLMGARQEADTYLQGTDQFNDRLFSAPLWTVDDALARASYRDRAVFSQMVKKVVANDTFTYRAMRRSGIELPWNGRVVATLNDDAESLQALPDIDGNILDKIMLLKVQKPLMDSWPSDAELMAELPFLAAFLRDFDMPEHCRGDSRFGVAPYRHPDLVTAANSLSVTSSFEEVLDLFRIDWFHDGPGQNDTEWIGNPTKLLADMDRVASVRSNVGANFKSAT